MKKVVQYPSNEVILSSLNNSSIVGIFYKNCDQKSAVLQLPNENFIGFGGTGLSLVGSWTHTTLLDYVRRAVSNQDATAYVFDTKEDLFKWLSEPVK